LAGSDSSEDLLLTSHRLSGYPFAPVDETVPLILFEDEHLLVIQKPAGWNTHAPSPHAGEGVYEWLRVREPRWASLAIIHRLDKETSGVLVFGKSTEANRSLTAQFAGREVGKRYRLWTDRPVAFEQKTITSRIARNGDNYRSVATGGDEAVTDFRVIRLYGGRTELEAEPHTGRTHQIRVHASENGFSILGDSLYGGSPFHRVCLHAAVISFKHPATGLTVSFSAEDVGFEGESRVALRQAIIDPALTNAYRLIHGAADGHPDWFVERLGDWLLSLHETDPSPAMLKTLQALVERLGCRGVYHKRWNPRVRETNTAEASPKLVLGEAAPERFIIRENGLNYELSFDEGYSVGLFLDQRDNRRRWQTGHVANGFDLGFQSGAEVLNTFAYTCGFSVAAAASGARVTSLDLSKKYLDWGRRNLALNGIDPAAHDFIFGDCFDWLRRLAKKGRKFHGVILDPPTFSQSKESGVFRAPKDFGRLVGDALAVLAPDGVLLASCNAANWTAEEFVAAVHSAVQKSGPKIRAEHYSPQPPDFPVSRDQPAYLKTLWLRVS